jgi:hypothetical protein
MSDDFTAPLLGPLEAKLRERISAEETMAVFATADAAGLLYDQMLTMVREQRSLAELPALEGNHQDRGVVKLVLGWIDVDPALACFSKLLAGIHNYRCAPK